MLLRLSKIIEVPDSALPFETQLDLHEMQFGGCFPVQEPVAAKGEINNTAGVLLLEGTLTTVLHGDCDCRPETDPRLAVLGQLLKDK